jgi:quinol monooxygenase YgiN
VPSLDALHGGAPADIDHLAGEASGHGEVRLSGQLVCNTRDQAETVQQHLQQHLALTRAEPGCQSFNVTKTSNPLIWQVEERFEHAAAFEAHQERVTSSDWGHATAGIERR